MTHTMQPAAAITIGVPVFNGADGISRTLESILAQTYPRFTVRISDNASTDATGEICRSFAARDPRITYERLNSNLGAVANFRRLIESVDSELFVFLAADDYWLPSFLERNVEALERAPEAVASISSVDFVERGRFHHHASGAAEILGPPVERLTKFLKSPSDNSRFYSLFRREALAAALIGDLSFHALDWYVMAKTLLTGSHVCVQEVLMMRENAGHTKYHESVERDNAGSIGGDSFPLLPLSRALLGEVTFRRKIEILPALTRLNWKIHKQFIAYKHPKGLYSRFLSKI